MPYILNRRPKPKPPQNNVMTINKALKAVNDTMDWTVLFIAIIVSNGLVRNSVQLLARPCYQYIVIKWNNIHIEIISF